MKVKGMGIREILRRMWLFSANKINSSESFSKQPTQLIVELNSSLRYIIVIQKSYPDMRVPHNQLLSVVYHVVDLREGKTFLELEYEY